MLSPPRRRSKFARWQVRVVDVCFNMHACVSRLVVAALP